MVLHLAAYLVPGMVALFALPMAIGKVPPNGAYGYRTRKTFSSPSIWYAANRFAGWAMIIMFALAICFNLTVWRMHPDWPVPILFLWMCFSVAFAPFLALTASCIYLRRL
ncbi:MAG: SdpI family protein [Bryobacteraceae bacterium]